MRDLTDETFSHRLLEARKTRTIFLFPLLFALAAGFWLSPFPSALGRDLSLAELIQQGLPGRQTLKSASKADLLSATCRAVRQRRGEAAAITSAAVTAHPAFAADIVARLLSCSGKIDCEFVGAIVTAAAAAESNSATRIGDAAMARMPNCADTIERAIKEAAKHVTSGPTSPGEATSAVSSPGAEESFDPLEPLNLVCDNGTRRAIRQSMVNDFLRLHPGSFRGACPPTPSPSPTLSPRPAASPVAK